MPMKYSLVLTIQFISNKMGNTPSIIDKKGSTYDDAGFNGYGFHRDTHLHRDTNTIYNKSGLNYRGFRTNGIHNDTDSAYDKEGFDVKDWSKLDNRSYSHFHRLTGTVWDPSGFSIDGCDKHGYNRKGFHVRTNRRRDTGTYFDPNGYYITGEHESKLVFTKTVYGRFDQYGRRFGDLYSYANCMQDSQYH